MHRQFFWIFAVLLGIMLSQASAEDGHYERESYQIISPYFRGGMIVGEDGFLYLDSAMSMNAWGSSYVDENLPKAKFYQRNPLFQPGDGSWTTDDVRASSFESAIYRGWYLQHHEGKIRLADRQLSAEFRRAATFRYVKELREWGEESVDRYQPPSSGSTRFSLESAESPGYYLVIDPLVDIDPRSRATYRIPLILAPDDGTSDFRLRASWSIFDNKLRPEAEESPWPPTLEIVWIPNSKRDGYFCTPLLVYDGSFCSSQDLGLEVSLKGPVRSKKCTPLSYRTQQDSKPYICIKPDAGVTLGWSDIRIRDAAGCARYKEDGRYLCYSINSSLAPMKGSLVSIEVEETTEPGADEVYIRYYLDDQTDEDGEPLWRRVPKEGTQSMNEGSDSQVWDPDITAVFRDQMVIEIWEEDNGPDDLIGRETLNIMSDRNFSVTYKDALRNLGGGKLADEETYHVRYEVVPQGEAVSATGHPILYIKSITCLMPSSGIDRDAAATIAQTWVQEGAGNVLSGNFVAGGLLLAGAGTAGLTLLIDDADPGPDQTYLEIDGKRRWPSEGTQSMDKGDSAELALEIRRWNKSRRLVIRDKDDVSGDDIIATLSIDPTRVQPDPATGKAVLIGEFVSRDGAAYRIDFEIWYR